MYRCLLVVLVLVISGCVTMQGVVRDKVTGSPIPSATVTVDRSSAITNGFGHYKLQGVFSPGDTVMINAPGYNIYTRTIKSTNEIVDVDLTPK